MAALIWNWNDFSFHKRWWLSSLLDERQMMLLRLFALPWRFLRSKVFKLLLSSQ